MVAILIGGALFTIGCLLAMASGMFPIGELEVCLGMNLGTFMMASIGLGGITMAAGAIRGITEKQ